MMSRMKNKDLTMGILGIFNAGLGDIHLFSCCISKYIRAPGVCLSLLTENIDATPSH